MIFTKTKYVSTKIWMMTVLSVAVLTVSGCQDVKQTLGVGRNSPDEFTVVKRAPLTLPPEYGLRPPSDPYMQSSSTVSDKAKTIVLGTQSAQIQAGTADQALLQKMGAYDADSGIRRQIEQDNGYIALQNKSVADKLMFWDGSKTTAEDIPTSIVDANAEKERLQKNEAEGQPANAGDVPVIEKKKGTIDRFF